MVMETLATQTGSIPVMDDDDSHRVIMTDGRIISKLTLVPAGLIFVAILGTVGFMRAWGNDSERITVLETKVEALTSQVKTMDGKVDKNGQALARIEGHLGTKPDE